MSRRDGIVRLLLLLGCAANGLTGEAVGVTFTDVTSSAGIVYSLPDPLPPLGDNPIAESGGAAAGDFDNDGWTDLFVTRYWDTPFLYRNNHDGTFSDVTASAFSAGIPGTNSSGASWGDIDNDGDLDLAVSTVYNSPGNALYINDGSGQFTEQAAARGTNIGGASFGMMSTSFGDYDNDGYLDMYTSEWRGLSGYTGDPTRARLLRNRGAAQPGYFDDVTAASGAAMGPLSGVPVYQSNSFTPRFVDFDRDGHTDIFVNSDNGSSRLFWNNGNGTFTDGTGPIDSSLGLSDMGLAIGDIDGNGLLDFFTTDVCHPSNCSTSSGNRLFRNFGNRTFLESSLASGVREAGWGWGTQMFDYDNDKDLDIVATNGYYTSATVPPGFENDAIRLFRNNGQGGVLTTFTNVASDVGMTDTSQGRGLLKFDYDRDGDLDVFIVNNFQAPVLYRNDGGNQAGDWLQIETEGTISNADGVGAFITVTPDLAFPNKKLVHEVTLSSSFLSQSEPIAHFGLGANSGLIDLVRIEWPASGIVQELYNVTPNQRLLVVEQRPGDFDSDGDVDGRDFLLWQQGRSLNPLSASDLADWQANYGTSGIMAANVAVPEPSSLVMAGLSLVGALGLRRHG
jgi:hypothetical protein